MGNKTRRHGDTENMEIKIKENVKWIQFTFISLCLSVSVVIFPQKCRKNHKE
ncbi:hypothetical protein KKG61_07050 [bacterium]|nr:hypothetical protein [bacterium]MBU1599843.1 hypothetical protein [bacterium]MBU2461399.1 hypothetical protein [bacterium]